MSKPEKTESDSQRSGNSLSSSVSAEWKWGESSMSKTQQESPLEPNPNGGRTDPDWGGLEFGASYFDGNGDIVRIVQHSRMPWDCDYPYVGDNNRCYTREGYWIKGLDDHANNLVKLHLPAPEEIAQFSQGHSGGDHGRAMPPGAYISHGEPNPKQKYGDAKVKMQLVPQAAVISMARGLAEGAEKYGAWNWRDQPVEFMTYVGAIQRHLAAFIEGEDIDPDGAGKSHIDGAAACIAILCDIVASGNFIDNRPAVKNQGVLDALQQGSRKSMEAQNAEADA